MRTLVRTLASAIAATVLAAGGLSLAACSDATAPRGAQGTYSLVSVDAQTPPARVPTGGRSQFYEIANGTIQLGNGSSAILTFSARDTSLASGYYRSVTAAATYSLAGQTLVVRHQSPVTLATFADTGAVQGDTMRIRMHFAATDSAVVAPMLVLAR